MKNKYLFDTDVLIDYLRGFPEATILIQKYFKSSACYISSITVAELHSGVKTQEESVILNKFLHLFHIVSIDHGVAETGGQLRKEYAKSHGVGLADALIAATAQSINAQLITLNIKHFPMFKGIKKPYNKTDSNQILSTV